MHLRYDGISVAIQRDGTSFRLFTAVASLVSNLWFRKQLHPAIRSSNGNGNIQIAAGQ
jgi:hypothetical protein